LAVYLNKFSYKIGLLKGGAFAEHAQTNTSRSSVAVRQLKLGTNPCPLTKLAHTCCSND